MLVLARHGNTFAPGEPAVWTGTGNDLTLVARGREQATDVAEALAVAGVRPVAVYCGPLSRTREYAAIICDNLHLQAPVVDARLSEIDYGEWTGLTQEEVVARFGRAAVEAWDRRAEWPASGGWGGSAAQYAAAARSFAADVHQRHGDEACVLAVTSNGTLRFFAALDPPAFAARRSAATLKVKTGHLGLLTGGPASWRLHGWNLPPRDAFELYKVAGH